MSVYRDKYTRFGIPDGGDGGKGADIIVRAQKNLHTLLDFQFHREFRGSHGGHGSSKQQKGKDILPVIIRVPCGTIIHDAATGCLLRDLKEDGEELLVARGGKGGLGSRHKGVLAALEPGEEKNILLDLKIIADIGLVGFPNAGKSTLITALTSAHSKVAAYPFTTKFPVLGVVQSEDDSFVIADIPGLIEGSSEGKGLGDKFLRHVERTKVLVHIIDMSGTDGRDPIEDYKIINQELRQYNLELSHKKQIVVVNKMDLEQSSKNLESFRKVMRKKIYPISALKGDGVSELAVVLLKTLRKSNED